MTNLAVVVPLKNFDIAKERLRRAGTPLVSQLARDLARQVIQSCAPRTVVVLSESTEVTAFARALGARVLESDARNLNEAAQGAYLKLGDEFEQLIYVHGDLLHPSGLGTFIPGNGVTIVSDHHGRGTNVLVVPTGTTFEFSYGPDSRRRHEEQARRLQLDLHVITESPWCFDVDEPEDLQGQRAKK